MKNQNGILIKAEGGINEFAPANGTNYNLDELYKAINCERVEVVQLTAKHILIIDEEGKFCDKPVNTSATSLAHLYGAIFKDDYIVGDVVLCLDNMFQ